MVSALVLLSAHTSESGPAHTVITVVVINGKIGVPLLVIILLGPVPRDAPEGIFPVCLIVKLKGFYPVPLLKPVDLSKILEPVKTGISLAGKLGKR